MYNVKRWCRKESRELNYAFFSQLYDFKQKASQSKSCDHLVKESVMNNMKYFDFLSLTKDQIRNKMPIKSDNTVSIKDSEEALSLAAELHILTGLREKIKEILTKVFQSINDENVTTMMIKVLQKKTTEQAVNIKE